MIFIFILSGCSSKENPVEIETENDGMREAVQSQTKEEDDENPEPEMILPETIIIENPEIEQYFQGINGCAVFYIPDEETYIYYNSKLWEKESSPCSTFKIISTWMALEHKVVTKEDSTMEWNGTTYWKEDWNNDIDLLDAFRASCVWYYREIINRLGEETVQKDLERLEYGNGDISDWEGILNTNNNSMDLRGFWIESTLKISPRRQTEVLQLIFEGDGICSNETKAILKEVMLVDNENKEINIYGKTGMGVKNGQCVDAWFVGMFEEANQIIYFAVRLDDPENKEVDSMKAKEIAISIINAL